MTSLDEEALAVEHGDGAEEILAREALCHQLGAEEASDAGPRCARSEDQDPLIPHRRSGLPRGGHHPRERHRGRALDVVVEREDPLAVAGEQVEGVLLLEVLELKEHLRVHLKERRHQLLHERIVVGAPEALLSHPCVVRILEQLAAVGAHIEGDGQHLPGMKAGRGAVEGQLADGDPHAACAEVSEAQDPLSVGEHHEPNLAAQLLEQRSNVPAVARGDPEAPRPAHRGAPALARQAHRRGVGDGHQLFDVVDEQPVVEDLVARLEVRKTQVASEGRGLRTDLLKGELDLLGEGTNPIHQEAREVEGRALLVGEGVVSVGEGIAENGGAAEGEALGVVTSLGGSEGGPDVGLGSGHEAPSLSVSPSPEHAASRHAWSTWLVTPAHS